MTVQLGRYKVIKELGRGGMGVVFLAEDTVLDRQVAVKVLPPAGRKETGAQARQRFLREARVSARLDHPFVIHLLDIGQADGCDYLVMEYIRGGSLRDRLDDGLLGVPAVCRFFWEICQGVSYAHQMGVVHRDLKPDNIMVTHDGHIKIMDFGLAWQEGQARLTGDGAVMGTLAYFAPEQARGERVDARADIYSLGAILFEMLTGRLVFEAASALHMIEQVLNQPAPSPRIYVQSVPSSLDSLIERCLRKDPATRYQTVADMSQALESFMVSTHVSVGALAPDGVPAAPHVKPAPPVVLPAPAEAQGAAQRQGQPPSPNGPAQLGWDRIKDAVAHMQKNRVLDSGVSRYVPPPAPPPPSPPAPVGVLPPATASPAKGQPVGQTAVSGPAKSSMASAKKAATPSDPPPAPPVVIEGKRLADGRYLWTDAPPARS